MKKDALYYGSLAAFVAFVLMIVATVVSTFNLPEKTEYRASVPSESLVETERDRFGEMVTLIGDDGATMILVPEGTFPMGSDAGEGDPDEAPRRPVFLSAYYIDLYEITRAQYLRFAQATNYPQPAIPVFEDDTSKIFQPGLPVVGVSWEIARAYCQWAGKRLPTEAEWEKAAAGERGFKWPWGNTFGDGLANVHGAEDGAVYTAPPGQYELGRSPAGLYDMAGNVAEWVADWYAPETYRESLFRDPKGPEIGKHRVYRGGSWNDSSANVRVSKRFAAAPHQTSAVIGFRCARDAKPGPA